MSAAGAGASRRRWLAPEVIQTSAMDCGPAALKCLLEGFGVPVSYARLQEACQTDVDGTSIDVIEELAGTLGLDAEQVMQPVDHALRPEMLPALLVTREANHMTHFVVVWRRHGPLAQVMDPARGRRWMRWERLAEQAYVHRHPVAAAGWRQWAASEDFLVPLRARLGALGMDAPAVESLIAAALADPDWRPLGRLDAAVRMVDSLVRSGGLRAGPDAERVLRATLARGDDDGGAAVPAAYWSVTAARDGEAGEGTVVLRGAVLVRVRGRRAAAGEADPAPADRAAVRSPELGAALREPGVSPAREVLRLLRESGALAPAALLAGSLLAAAGVLLEALLLQSFFELGRVLSLGEQRLTAVLVLLSFSAALLVGDGAIAGGVMRLGRELEIRLRLALYRKLPQLGDRYFQSRLVSDMAQRAHSLQAPRALPELGSRLARSAAQLVLTVVGIAWIDLASAPAALLAGGLALALPLVAQPLFAERELGLRSHGAALSRVYLDALLGLAPARTHGAERALRASHEGLLVGWTRGGLGLLRAVVAIDGAQSIATLAVVVALVAGYVARGGEPAAILLLTYWALALPVLGRDLAAQLRQYAGSRNVVARLLEPLSAPAETPSDADEAAPIADRGAARGVALGLEGVAVRVTGHTILESLHLSVAPGEHVAIVGLSGAGKSTLLGLFLGWHRATEGRVLVDGAPLEGPRLAALRHATAWVDPSVQLWNRAVLDNLCYGNSWPPVTSFTGAIESAELVPVLERLPNGLRSPLGEGGALTSGGEGQRIRFARALLRPDVRLALLDEPFRGLDRPRRRALLARARHHWREATLLCVTHDVIETRRFDRVLVVEHGRIVEDGAPECLAEKAGSRYRNLLEAEAAVQAELWRGTGWRHLRVEAGRVRGGEPPWE